MTHEETIQCAQKGCTRETHGLQVQFEEDGDWDDICSRCIAPLLESDTKVCVGQLYDYWCDHCDEIFDPDEQLEEGTCPHCDRELSPTRLPVSENPW